jgi:hypothetical protein
VVVSFDATPKTFHGKTEENNVHLSVQGSSVYVWLVASMLVILVYISSRNSGLDSLKSQRDLCSTVSFMALSKYVTRGHVCRELKVKLSLP